MAIFICNYGASAISSVAINGDAGWVTEEQKLLFQGDLAQQLAIGH